MSCSLHAYRRQVFRMPAKCHQIVWGGYTPHQTMCSSTWHALVSFALRGRGGYRRGVPPSVLSWEGKIFLYKLAFLNDLSRYCEGHKPRCGLWRLRSPCSSRIACWAHLLETITVCLGVALLQICSMLPQARHLGTPPLCLPQTRPLSLTRLLRSHTERLAAIWQIL